MLTVATWLWGGVFSPLYVERLRSMLARHLHLRHELVCITDKPQFVRSSVSAGVRVVVMPLEHAGSPRCRRRMWQYATERRHDLGERILACDLDVVITDDITPILDRPEPIVLWRVGYAGVYSGSFQLFNAGAIDGAWQAFKRDPVGYPTQTGERFASDQAMLNHWIKVTKTHVAAWTERDGLITWFGDGYAGLEHHGMGPTRNALRKGTRVVVLGSSDKAVMDEGRYPFIQQHWR